jgi:DEAD/DEAH box helicase domain-containing protein
VEDILEFLTEEQLLHARKNKWYWMNDSFPAHNISLRSASQENVVIIDQSNVADVQVIGEMDRFSALTLLHEEAIYLHQGTQYQVEKLDYEEKKAFVRQVDVDYYTDANLAVQLKVLEEDKRNEQPFVTYAFGDVTVNAMATIFKKIKFDTHENVGSGPIHLPEEELHTNAAWFSLSADRTKSFGEEALEQGLIGLGHVLRHVCALFVMCDIQDLFVAPQVKAVHNEAPTVFLYDRYPGGVGLSEQVYRSFPSLMMETRRVIETCACDSGCPSCVGISAEAGERGKEMALQLLRMIEEEGVSVVSER